MKPLYTYVGVSPTDIERNMMTKYITINNNYAMPERFEGQKLILHGTTKQGHGIVEDESGWIHVISFRCIDNVN